VAWWRRVGPSPSLWRRREICFWSAATAPAGSSSPHRASSNSSTETAPGARSASITNSRRCLTPSKRTSLPETSTSSGPSNLTSISELTGDCPATNANRHDRPATTPSFGALCAALDGGHGRARRPRSPLRLGVEVGAHRRRRLHAVAPHARFDAGADRLDHLDSRVALVLGLDQVPRSKRVVGPLQHVGDRLLVVAPLLTVVPVVRRELPLLQRIIAAALEATQLLLGRDV